MQKRPMGRTGLMVTDLCLGTMTFGSQTDIEDSHRQIDMALDAGLNFMDAAEMYPVNPVKKETAGRTEEFIGEWFAKTGKRDQWIVATKHTGAGQMACRDGAPISAETIAGAIEGSLRRLKTDVIDLYQFHWPNRGSFAFRQMWKYKPWKQDREKTMDSLRECIAALQAEVKKGTIRHFGLSNDSAWGVMTWNRLADEMGGPRVSTLQNEYSLLYRQADLDLAETLHHEDVGLLPYSPLGAGLLTGKYQNGVIPEGSRMDINGDLGGRKTDRVFLAVAAYQEVADRFGLDLTQMALAFSRQKPFICSSIFGATTSEQLAHILAAKDLVLDDEVMKALDAVHKEHTFPF